MIKKVWSFLEFDDRKRSAFVFFISIFSAILEVISVSALVPVGGLLLDEKFSFTIFDYQLDNLHGDHVLILVIVMAIFSLKNILSVSATWQQQKLLKCIEVNYQRKLLDWYSRKDFQFHLTNDSSILTKNILNMPRFVLEILEPLLVLSFEFVVCGSFLIILLWLEPLIMTLTLSVFLIALGVFNFIVSRHLKSIAQDREKLESLKIKQIRELFASIREIILFGRRNFFLNEIIFNLNSLAEKNMKFKFLLSLPRMYLELAAVLSFCVLAYSMSVGFQRSSNQLAFLVFFLGAVLRLLPSLNRIIVAINSLKVGRSQLNDLPDELFCTAPHHSISTVEITMLKANIELVGVSFTYPEKLQPTLNDLNFSISNGQMVGIHGDSGIGKTTFGNVLLGLLSPSHGTLTVDGSNMAQELFKWQSCVAFVPQNVYLLNSSIRSNITLSNDVSEIDQSQFEVALQVSGVKEFVAAMPEGFNSKVGELGSNLSTGQIQRIGIARAVYMNRLFYLFDESTSALDEAMEFKVMSNLRRFLEKKTSIVISHRRSTLRFCDSVWAMREGKLIPAQIENLT